jgi:hypothetical protein
MLHKEALKKIHCELNKLVGSYPMGPDESAILALAAVIYMQTDAILDELSGIGQWLERISNDISKRE